MSGSKFMIRTRAVLATAAGCLAAASCGAATSLPTPAAPPVTSAPISASSPVTEVAAPEPTVVPPATIPPTTASPTPTGPPKFSAKVSRVARERLEYSWRPGCPVPVGDLRLITMTYWGFDGKPHTGELVVHEDAADDIVSVFHRLYDWRWPIYKMRLVDAYKADDFASIDADNTSAFNCRPAEGSSSWSKHAYGLAVDINPRENPYIYANGTGSHKNAREFFKRPVRAPGVINPGDRVVRAFQQKGWEWGGYWSGIKDYQHFSKGGN
ncbi:M15 family metallopeptidase [Streptosporangium sp. NBC_01469]|uniref:M15 family metallopeptidase n=2 Tax=unclassified Streptosporangium TaxID=2632669 RepID=UPI002E2E582A|nr:M15 family metallopeptidase [Streptosporangium sp. NBC_01469]